MQLIRQEFSTTHGNIVSVSRVFGKKCRKGREVSEDTDKTRLAMELSEGCIGAHNPILSTSVHI